MTVMKRTSAVAGAAILAFFGSAGAATADELYPPTPEPTLEVEARSVCVGDVPFLSWDAAHGSDIGAADSDGTVTITFLNPGGADHVLSGQPMSGQVLWPGAEMDAEGNLRIVDRVKELIIRGGYNVYPSEVEAVLYEHPDIIEAAVIGIPHDHYGEEVAAVVVVRHGAPQDGPSITAWARERLSAYKIPRVVQFVDKLPTGSTGKLLKRAIDRAPLADMLAGR